MSNPSEERSPNLDDVMETTEDDVLPQPIAQGHAGMPDRLDDDALEAAAERERVEAGLKDYSSDQVPPAADPLPPGFSEAADRAQRGLTEPEEDSD
jgi:ParB-like chromosome segregation protein Spo0J